MNVSSNAAARSGAAKKPVRSMTMAAIGTVVGLLLPSPASSQSATTTAQGSEQTPAAGQSVQPLGGKAARKAAIARWLDLQNATLNVRYRFVDTSAGVTTTNLLQYRESLRGRVKFDKPGRYSLNFGLFSGTRFTSGWDSTGWGNVGVQRNLAFKQLYVAAQPIPGTEVQYGGLYLLRGESTEITTYDEDGYVVGQRASVKRPKQLFFDEISATYAYLGDVTSLGISKRYRRLKEPNYRQLLVTKKIGNRAGVSADYTFLSGAETWRQALNLKTRELQIVDSILFEHYRRTNVKPDYGFALSVDKAINKKLLLGGGYGQIDPHYGGLNADRFNIGKRVFFSAAYQLSPELTASTFVTTAVGKNVSLPQRTLLNVVFAYNVLTSLKRTGLF